ncbi:alpha-mannosyl-glycoprotein beta-2-n [Histomonas meleagridis]|uniref:alpha--mannosyl-glycoprotein beta-2-n n=1 Tax=Histomonas meleagridis TaxID=135588 RepID=UPI00355A2951|nr:alpha-mannosyl-glycoprotein beta-2-n [Histomonas meleagridis]KAH0800819.1 alpha--mannosyl-glycoprotein beta-2-n [Histomonas meleagridis]
METGTDVSSNLSFEQSVLGDYDTLFDREVIINFNSKEKRIIRLKILKKQDEEGATEEICIEMIDDNNICFCVECIITPDKFKEIKKENSLLIDFEQFPKSVIELLELSVKSPKEAEIIFTFDENTLDGTISFIQTLRLRKVVIFKLNFVRSSDEFTKAEVQHRFNKARTELQKKTKILESKLAKIESINPSYAKQVWKIIEAIE